MIIVSHPTVNAFNRALAETLHSANRLAAFHTTLAFGRRSVGLPRESLRLHPWPEIGRLTLQRLGLAKFTRGRRNPLSVDAVYRALDAGVARDLEGAAAVYAYEDGALATFRAARERGLRRFYELPIAYWETTRRLLRQEAERLPEWARTLGALDDSPMKLARKTDELALADLVICPSRFVQASLPHGTRNVVAEFGSPPLSAPNPPRPSGPLRLLFAGAMTQRKGLADLFAALRLLRHSEVELVVMGAPLASHEFYRKAFPHYIYEPPRPHSKVLELMGTCDILVLPSIVEGRALVQQEALSRGLPLIVTPNAGGEDLIEPGETGWLVPIRDPAAIAERIAWFAERRDLLPHLRGSARRKSAENTWAQYAQKS